MQAIFDLLAQHRSPMLIIGGHALTAHGVQRLTFDVDCLVATADFEALSQLLIRGGFSNVQHQQNFSAFNSTSLDKVLDIFRRHAINAETSARSHRGRRDS